MENLKIKIIIGSTREGRFGDKAAQWIAEVAKKREGVEIELLDLRDYAMPFFSEPKSPSAITEPYTNEAVARWTKKVSEADAYIVATPEYNHGYPAVLKNAFDYVGREWHNKPVGFIAWGTLGGVRAIEQLRTVVAELQLASVRNAVYITTPWLLLDEKGALKSGALDSYSDAADRLLDQLTAWGKAFKAVRG